jgi:hypothetical protein
MRGHRALGATVLGALLLFAAGAQASPDTYPLERVRAGQTGYGLTTMSGTKPERFTFEVVSVVHNFLPKQDIILVKSDDKKLEVTGFWQGMSGSPLYIEDKLVCAFSYGFRFNKVSLGGCTPIEYMKKEGLATPRRATTIATKAGGPRIVQQSAASMADWKRLAPTVDPQAAMNALGPAHRSWLLSAPLPAPIVKPTDTDQGAMTASVPLAVSGFSAPAFAQLEQLFSDSNLTPMRAGGTGAATTSTSRSSEAGPSKFEMGGSIAVELIRGDMSAAATGTVSYIDGNNVLAFGHPMFQTGETYMPVATSFVHTVVPSAQSAFVLASPIKEIGSLVQDRQSAIAADTNLRTPSIPVSITITSGKGKVSEKGTFNVELLDNKFLTAPLAGAALMNAVQYYLPDRDDVTARVESSVKVKGYPGNIEFVDYLYANDGASSVMGAVRGLRVLVPLLMNPYAPLTIERVDVKVELEYAANYGDIKEVKIPTTDLIAGERNMVSVVMSTWNGKDIVDQVPVDVPANLAGSIVQLEVTSGDSAKLDAAPPKDLPSLIAAFKKLLPGNVWAATIYPADEGVALDGALVKDLPQSALDKLHPQSHTQRASQYKVLFRTTAPAKRVVNGSASTLVRVRAK